VVVAAKQDAQFVVHPVVATVATHAVVPVYPAAQALQVRALDVIVHCEQPTTKPVAVPAAATGEATPVVQLTQAPAVLRAYPALQSVQVPAAALHKRQFVSVHEVRTQAGVAFKTYPGLHVVHVVALATLPTGT